LTAKKTELAYVLKRCQALFVTQCKVHRPEVWNSDLPYTCICVNYSTIQAMVTRWHAFEYF